MAMNTDWMSHSYFLGTYNVPPPKGDASDIHRQH